LSTLTEYKGRFEKVNRYASGHMNVGAILLAVSVCIGTLLYVHEATYPSEERGEFFGWKYGLGTPAVQEERNLHLALYYYYYYYYYYY
jgi:hypothetical protein